jgi:hypothetical protein
VRVKATAGCYGNGTYERDKEEVYLNAWSIALGKGGFIIFVHTSALQSYEVEGRAG